jgi:cytochrome c biogenesis protein CcmG, thiol:disulfide interchange protein DsbE
MTEHLLEVQGNTDSPDVKKRGWRDGGYITTFAVVMAVLGLLGYGLIKVQAGPRDRGPAPDFTLQGFDGSTWTLSEMRGNIVVINFWASWCLPCREEADYLEQTWRKYRDQGVVFIGVGYADTEKEALAYLEEFDITYPNGPDLGTRISKAYNLQGVPETFFVDNNGELQGVHVGPIFPPQLENKIEELLNEE